MQDKLIQLLSVCNYCSDLNKHTTNIHAGSYVGFEGAARNSALFPTLPNLTCVTFRVFSSLECDWKRKTMHWSSLDSVLLSALQRKHGRERGRRKINHIYIILSGCVKKKKTTSHRCLAVTHPRAWLHRVCLALGSVNPLSMCRAKVKAIQKCSSAPLTFEFRGRWEQSMVTSKLEGGADKTNRSVWHAEGKDSPATVSNHHTHHWQPILQPIMVTGYQEHKKLSLCLPSLQIQQLRITA